MSNQKEAASSLHTEVSAEPELGDFRSSNQDVVATIELSNVHVMKAPEWNGDVNTTAVEMYGKKTKQEPTVAVIPAGDILPMQQQDKLGGGEQCANCVFDINDTAAIRRMIYLETVMAVCIVEKWRFINNRSSDNHIPTLTLPF